MMVGDGEWLLLAERLSEAERNHIATRLVFGAGECWIWTGTWTAKNQSKLMLRRGDRQAAVHRVLVAALNGRAPKAKLTRVCGSIRCVRPTHWLEPGEAGVALFERRLLSKIDRTEECWTWIGKTYRGGYGRISRSGRQIAAHRAVYELLVGPIPEGLVLDHLCRNRRCVRPEHLEPVSLVENLRRGFAAALKEETVRIEVGPRLVVETNHLTRFWSKVARGGTEECWMWTPINLDEYPTFTIGSRSSQRTWDAHRFVYLVTIGTPGPGVVLDHRCGQKRCVNPGHLEPVSRNRNSLRWAADYREAG